MKCRKKTAFTLVELLVVIGIIAVLVGILLPTLRRARQAAVQTVCASNLHQISVLFQIYTNENKGWFPHTGANGYFYTQAGTTFQGTWSERLVLGATSKQFVKNWNTHYPVSKQESGIFYCPAWGAGNFERKDDYTAIDDKGYGVNYWFAQDSNPATPLMEYWVKVSKLAKGKVLVCDGYSKRIATNLTGSFGVYLRHNKGANYIFPDWHVEWNDTYQKENSSNPAQHWYYAAPITEFAKWPSDHT